MTYNFTCTFHTHHPEKKQRRVMLFPTVTFVFMGVENMREGTKDKSESLYTPTIHSVGQLSTLLVSVTGSIMHLSTRNNVPCDILEEHGMLYCLKNHRR